jgi:serine/threonine protein kinase
MRIAGFTWKVFAGRRVFVAHGVVIHDQGWLHRDIKPENVLVNEDDHVKLIDFSIALPLHRSFWSRLFGRTELSEGTPTYLSPEQILREPLDLRSDIYSYGVLAYEMITGRPPIR